MLIEDKQKYRTEEIANLIADVLCGESSRHTAKPGSSYDRDRKRIIKEIKEGICGTNNAHINVDTMFEIFIAGINWAKEHE